MTQIEIRILQRARRPARGIALYATIRNEAYFLPHFLAHYRALGVGEFCFLDDHSDDGTPDLLAREPDVTLLRSNLRFGDVVGQERFGIASRTIVPRKMYLGRWVVTADLDEFMLLPPGIRDLPDLVDRLDHQGLQAVRALMLDFYPDTLSALDSASPTAHPLEVAPNFDIPAFLDWPDGASRPQRVDHLALVRPRLAESLFRLVPDARQSLQGYKLASMNKVPLVRWSEHVVMHSAHRINLAVSDRVQLVLRHHKFHPELRIKVADALATGAYWNASIEYRMLDMALRHLPDADLRTLLGHTRHATDPARLVDNGLLYARV